MIVTANSLRRYAIWAPFLYALKDKDDFIGA